MKFGNIIFDTNNPWAIAKEAKERKVRREMPVVHLVNFSKKLIAMNKVVIKATIKKVSQTFEEVNIKVNERSIIKSISLLLCVSVATAKRSWYAVMSKST